MSCDLEVYSPRETPFEKSDLKVALQKQGWALVFLHEDAFWDEKAWPILSESGPIETKAIMLAGWPLKNPLAPRLETLVQNRNFAEFKQIVESTLVLAACSLCPTIPYDGKAGFTYEEWNEFESAHPESAAAQSASHSHYFLSTNGGRTPWSMEFQHAAWKAIAEITDGVAENLQGDDLDWEELTGEKMGFVQRIKTALFNRRYYRARRRYGL